MNTHRKAANSRKPVRRTARSALTFRLPADVQSGLQRIGKFAGVSTENVIKLALAQHILHGTANVELRPTTVEVAGPRFTNLGADGEPTAGDHVAVRDATTGLIWAAAPLGNGKDMNHADAMKACRELQLLGHKDWRAPTITELLTIVDYDRNDPAVDPAHFKGPFSWTWTSSPYKGASGDAWLVYLRSGGSYWVSQVSQGRVRAVRAGQSNGLTELKP